MEITLSNGSIALVDLEDLDYLSQFSWTYSRNGKREYAMRRILTRSHSTTIYMHRVVAIRAGLKIEGLDVDHKNFKGLDCQRHNLRVLPRNLNCIGRENAPLSINNTSGFTGVVWRPDSNNWRAEIQYNGSRISLGSFEHFEEAINARINAEHRLFNRVLGTG